MLASDMHIHTIMSGHAFSTFSECVTRAEKLGLKLIAITDHGPSLEYSAHEGYFTMGYRIPKKYGDLSVLFGSEINIISRDGRVDLSSNTLSMLDFVSAGLHKHTPYSDNGEAANTEAIIRAMERHPEIDMITHPYRDIFPTSISDIVQASEEYNVILEVNLPVVTFAKKQNSTSSKLTIEKIGEMVSMLQSHGRGYLINSDAHISSEIGINQEDYKMLSSLLGINPQYVLNDNMRWINKMITP